MSHPRPLVSLCGLLLASACGSDKPAGPWRSGVETGISGASTNQAAREEVCESLDRHLGDALDLRQLTLLVCTPAGILRASTADVCERLIDQCMTLNAPQPLLSGSRIDRQRCVDQLTHCDAPMSALESCINQNVARVHQLLEQLSCDRFDDQQVVMSAARALDLDNAVAPCAELPPSCQNLIEDALVR